MKRFFLLVALYFMTFSLCKAWALDVSISREPLCHWILMLPVWNEKTGPCPLGELIFPEKKGFYSACVAFDSASDDGSWVDGVIADSDVFKVSSGVDLNGSSDVIPDFGTEIISRHIKDSYERLSFFSFGEEILSCTSTNEGKVLVFSDPKKIVRKTFDESMRLFKVEEWKKGEKASGNPAVVHTFSYSEGSKPVSSEMISETEKHVFSFDNKGKVILSENYKQFRKSEKVKPRFYKESQTEWTYNDKGKVITKSSLFFDFNKIYTEVTGKSSKKEVYEYKINDSIPDYFYYENDVLRLSTVYSGETSYITTMFFNDGFVVESVYENNKRKKDIYYLNGNVRRTKVYE